MKITIELDTACDRAHGSYKDEYRAAAALLLHLIGDDESAIERAADGSPVFVPALPPSVSPIPEPISAPVRAGQVGTYALTPNDPGVSKFDAIAVPSKTVAVPPPSAAIINFPVPPPPPIANTAAPTIPAPLVRNAAAVGTVAFAEYDSAGLPWDARIHGKLKNKKQDGTWKLQKGIDPAIVAAVVAELKGVPATVLVPPTPTPPMIDRISAAMVPPAGAVPPPPVAAPVTLPPGPLLPEPVQINDSLPLPAVPNAPATTIVPPPPTPASVPVPAVPASGSIGPTISATPGVATYRSLIDKLTAATRAGTITPARVQEIVQKHGAPNIMQLNSMTHLIPPIDAEFDLILAGLA